MQPLTPNIHHQTNNESERISPYVLDNYDFLCAMARTRSAKKRRKLLKRATTTQLLSLVEIALNVVKGCFRITTRQKSRMIPFADLIRRMSRTRSERGARRLMLEQRGGGVLNPGFFAALLTPIILDLARSFKKSTKPPV